MKKLRFFDHSLRDADDDVDDDDDDDDDDDEDDEDDDDDDDDDDDEDEEDDDDDDAILRCPPGRGTDWTNTQVPTGTFSFFFCFSAF